MRGVDLAVLDLGDRGVALRRADAGDLTAIVALLAEDQVGATRDEVPASGEDEAPYRAAFEAIDADPAQLLVVAEECGEVVATLQLTFIPGLLYRGATRAQIEAVRVRADRRSTGIGAAAVGWAIEEARRRGCALVQFTSHKRRVEAHRFYGRMGFEATHEGFKLLL